LTKQAGYTPKLSSAQKAFSSPNSRNATPSQNMAQLMSANGKKLIFSATKQGNISALEIGKNEHKSLFFSPSRANGDDLQGQPDHFLLTNGESRLCFLESGASNKFLLQADVETGRVIRDVTCMKANNSAISNKTLDFVSVAHAESLYQQTATSEVLVSLFSNADDKAAQTKCAIGILDLRDKNALQHGYDKWEGKTYRTQVDFTCIATTAAQGENYMGWIVTGHEDGSIRLYEQGTSAATTAFKGCDPIIGVDVTSDGKYIVATTKMYVLFITTTPDGENVTGFQKSIPNGKRGELIQKLQIHPMDVQKYFGGAVGFTQPAKFNTASGNIHQLAKKDCTFVACSGKTFVVWDAEAAKQGKNRYQMGFTSSSIVTEIIEHNNPDSLVAQSEDDMVVVAHLK
jgi:hypothetical protein